MNNYSYMLLWENKVLDSPHEQTDNTQTWYLGECVSSGKWPEARGREPFIDGPNTIERAIDEAIGAILAYDKQNVMLGAGTICVLTATICDRTGQEIAKLEPTKATVVANNGRRLCDVTYAVVNYSDINNRACNSPEGKSFPIKETPSPNLLPK